MTIAHERGGAPPLPLRAPHRRAEKKQKRWPMEKDKNNLKKQIPLRLSAKLYAEIAAWAEDDFRSVNGQIEYLLTECVKKRKGEKK